MPEDVGCPCGHQGSVLDETNREGGRVGWNHSPIVRACLISAQHRRMVSINCLCMPSPYSALWAGSLVASFLHTFSASCSLLSGIIKLVYPSQSTHGCSGRCIVSYLYSSPIVLTIRGLM